MTERCTTQSSRHAGPKGRVLFSMLALSLLAIPGFALGLAAGIAWEEPGLLFGYLAGRGEDVVIRESGEPPRVARTPESPLPKAMPDVAAPAPPAPQAREATRLRTEPPSPLTAKKERFAVQVGAFSENESAERLAENLRKKGFDVYVSAGVKVTQARWRVRVGPFPNRKEAERAAGRLKQNEKLPTWVLDEHAAG
ncbi:MAG: SPOR domain-containing protein [Myxococcales bacterium]|nr:SPOR domain-containing protein [Myxococcales bacterium]